MFVNNNSPRVFRLSLFITCCHLPFNFRLMNRYISIILNIAELLAGHTSRNLNFFNL